MLVDKPGRFTLIGALSALLLAENGGDIADEVFIICDTLGIPRPDWSDEYDCYSFDWDRVSDA